MFNRLKWYNLILVYSREKNLIYFIKLLLFKQKHLNIDLMSYL